MIQKERHESDRVLTIRPEIEREAQTERCCFSCLHVDVEYPDQPCGECDDESFDQWAQGKNYRMPSDGA
jgi:hypothetical protein